MRSPSLLFPACLGKDHTPALQVWFSSLFENLRWPVIRKIVAGRNWLTANEYRPFRGLLFEFQTQISLVAGSFRE
jgi:hypothetical protein